MLKVSICPAVAEDAEAIAQLNEACFGQHYPVSSVRRQLETLILRPDEQLLVAVYRGQVIGYIHARDDLRTYRAPRKAVLSVAVAKAHRRQGVATALFDAVEQWAKRSRCEAVSAAVGGSRAAQSFFAAVGCEEGLNRKQYYKSVEDKASVTKERLENHGQKE